MNFSFARVAITPELFGLYLAHSLKHRFIIYYLTSYYMSVHLDKLAQQKPPKYAGVFKYQMVKTKSTGSEG